MRIVERQLNDSKELLGNLRDSFINERIETPVHGHEGDVGTTRYNLGVTDANTTRILNYITSLHAAHKKLAEGTFTGTCRKCKRAIPFERLEIVPHATLCCKCKS